MSSRRSYLGAAVSLAAVVAPLNTGDRDAVSHTDVDDVRPVNLTGHARGEGPDVLGLEHVTGFGEIEVSAGDGTATLRVHADTTATISVRTEGPISRSELVALRDEIDTALRGIDK